MNPIYGNSINMLGRSLDYLWERQNVINHNIANVETPDFKAKSLLFEKDFKAELDRALKSVGQEDEDKNQVFKELWNKNNMRVVERKGSTREDGNSVNLDVEQMELARTALQYQVGLQSIDSDISRLRTVIKGQ